MAEQHVKTQDFEIKPFANCPALDGCHCQTNSLAKIFYHYNHPISEEMILGLGAGMGFIYWQMKMGKNSYVFVGGRANNKDFFNDFGRRTGVKIKSVSTSSAKKAEASLLDKLIKQEPVMLFGDMGYLPWFEFPVEYHFGGHTFVVCGFDGESAVLASDMDPKTAGLKKGFYSLITLGQLGKARNSPHKPLPPKNTRLEFDFSSFHDPNREDIISSIKQTVESQLDPPIKNFGIKGIRHTAREITKWPGLFGDRELRMNLFNLYIFFEIGGTGGGCFRQMYARFLKEAARILAKDELIKASDQLCDSGKLFTEIGLLFKDAEAAQDLEKRITVASGKFNEIADLEESAFSHISAIV